MTLILANRQHPDRQRLEQAVRAVFLAEYGAHVPAFPDQLIASVDDNGMPYAVAGLRFGADGLFSDVYLDGPVETVLGRSLGRTVARDQIVEFSSLAAIRPGAALPLVAAAIRVCLAAGCRFGMFTATARLRALLRRSGLTCVDLGPALRERVEHPAAWGSYYLHDPRVLVVAADTLPTGLQGALDIQVARHA